MTPNKSVAVCKHCGRHIEYVSGVWLHSLTFWEKLWGGTYMPRLCDDFCVFDEVAEPREGTVFLS
jgi:hypothetical protein